MGVSQILELVQDLPRIEQLKIAEAILHSILEKEQHEKTSYNIGGENLSIAAEVLLQDYLEDDELTIFTQLDGDSIYEEGGNLAH